MTTAQKIKRNEKRVYTYYSENGNSGNRKREVFCDYKTYLFLKLCYGGGLSEKQYSAYRELACN